MAQKAQACKSKQKYEIQTYPSHKRLGQQHQKDKSWQKVRKHARETTKHARKQEHARKRNKAYY